MEAEERLKALYKKEEPIKAEPDKDGWSTIPIGYGGMYIAAEHIDLIANLVVERLLNTRRE